MTIRGEDWGEFTTMLARQEGRLLTVSFNRPDRLNAVGGGFHEEFTEILGRAGRDESIGAILLRGEGRAFCVGGDIKGFDERASGAKPAPPAHTVLHTLEATELLEAILGVPQPIVAAVHGYAWDSGQRSPCSVTSWWRLRMLTSPTPTSAWHSWPATVGR
jgi:enoyl-CoA hydratase